VFLTLFVNFRTLLLRYNVVVDFTASTLSVTGRLVGLALPGVRLVTWTTILAVF
jgi:hypothetical protein